MLTRGGGRINLRERNLSLPRDVSELGDQELRSEKSLQGSISILLKSPF